MGTRTTYEERCAIVTGAGAGETAQESANRFHVQRATVHKWRQAEAHGGDRALRPKMGRPATGAMSTLGTAMQERIRQMRNAHPGWGAVTLRVEPERERVAAERLPSVATINRFLKQEQRTQRPEPHRLLSSTTRQQAEAPHELWQMDARGFGAIPNVGMVTLINLNDCYSHLRLLSYPCRLGAEHVSRHATTEDYQWALRLAFERWGMPRTLQVDHESVFFDNRTHSPFPTRIHLWLIALGINLTFSRVHQPKDQGMTERSHQIWERQVLSGQTFPDWLALYHALNERRDVLNNDLPCRPLANQPPLVAFPEADHSGRFYSPEMEPHLLRLQRIHDYLAHKEWFRRIASNGTISFGGYVYYLGANLPRDFAKVTYSSTARQLHIATPDGQPLATLDIRGLTEETLMGDMATFTGLPARQPALPFDCHEQQLLRLYELFNVL